MQRSQTWRCLRSLNASCCLFDFFSAVKARLKVLEYEVTNLRDGNSALLNSVTDLETTVASMQETINQNTQAITVLQNSGGNNQNTQVIVTTFWLISLLSLFLFHLHAVSYDEKLLN